jgi:hypothetical protein
MKCTHVPHTNEIDLRLWGFETGNKIIDAVIGAVVTPIIREQFEEDHPRIGLPFYWSTSDGFSGPPVENPLTLYMHLPLGKNEESVVYSTTLAAVIDDDLFFENDYTSVDKLSSVASELERLAAEIRKRILAREQTEAAQ